MKLLNSMLLSLTCIFLHNSQAQEKPLDKKDFPAELKKIRSINDDIASDLRKSVDSEHGLIDVKSKIAGLFKQGMYVSDENIIALAADLVNFEERQAFKSKNENPSFALSKKVIPELEIYVQDRPLVLADLHRYLTGVYERLGDFENQALESQRAVEVSEKAKYRLDEILVTGQISQANALAKSGKMKEADSLYILAFQYPWWSVRDSYYSKRFLIYYYQAGRGLMEVRKADPQGLRDIRFSPMIAIEMKPELDEAIKKAEKIQIEAQLDAQLKQQDDAKKAADKNP